MGKSVRNGRNDASHAEISLSAARVTFDINSFSLPVFNNTPIWLEILRLSPTETRECLDEIAERPLQAFSVEDSMKNAGNLNDFMTSD